MIIQILIIVFLLFHINKSEINLEKLENNNNCYSYSFDNMKKNYTSKPQPGIFAKIPRVKRNKKEYKCKNFIGRVLADYPKSQFISTSDYKNGKRCNLNENTIFLALDNKGPSIDYHFYKQDSSGYWSHKPGLNKITYVDDNNNRIKNPLHADRNYENNDINNKKKYNYKIPCGFFCNPKK